MVCSSTAAPVDVSAAVNKQLAQDAAMLDLDKQFAIQRLRMATNLTVRAFVCACVRHHANDDVSSQGKKKKRLLLGVDEKLAANPLSFADHARPRKAFVDADELARDMIAKVGRTARVSINRLVAQVKMEKRESEGVTAFSYRLGCGVGGCALLACDVTHVRAALMRAMSFELIVLAN
jgi:hypothetical protein